MLVWRNGQWENIYTVGEHGHSELAFEDDVAAAVFHGNDANVSRPAGFSYVVWRGDAEPINAVDEDVWLPDNLGDQHLHDNYITNLNNVPSFEADTRANQPLPDPEKVGRIYYVTDEKLMERDEGDLWRLVAYGPIELLPSADPLDGTEKIPLEQGGVTKQIDSGTYQEAIVKFAKTAADIKPLIDEAGAEGGGIVVVGSMVDTIPAADLPWVIDSSHQNVKVRGQGWSSHIKCEGQLIDADNTEDQNRFEISNLRVERVNDSANTDHAIRVNYPRRWRIEDCLIEGFGGVSIDILGGIHTSIIRNQLIAKNGDGVGIAGIRHQLTSGGTKGTTFYQEQNYVGAGDNYGFLFDGSPTQSTSVGDVAELVDVGIRMKAANVTLIETYTEAVNVDHIELHDSTPTVIDPRATPTVTWENTAVGDRSVQLITRDSTLGSLELARGLIVGGGDVEMGNVGSTPSAPSAGGLLYVESAALKYVQPTGLVTTVASATTARPAVLAAGEMNPTLGAPEPVTVASRWIAYAYDDGGTNANERAAGEVDIPDSWSTVDIVIVHTTSTGNSGNAVIGVRRYAAASGDALNTEDSRTAATIPAVSAANETGEFTFASGVSIPTGRTLLAVERDGESADDDLTGDFLVLRIEIRKAS